MKSPPRSHSLAFLSILLVVATVLSGCQSQALARQAARRGKILPLVATLATDAKALRTLDASGTEGHALIHAYRGPGPAESHRQDVEALTDAYARSSLRALEKLKKFPPPEVEACLDTYFRDAGGKIENNTSRCLILAHYRKVCLGLPLSAADLAQDYASLRLAPPPSPGSTP